MSTAKLSAEVDALARHLLGPLQADTYPVVVMAIVAAALSEIGIPAQAQRCELLTQTNGRHSDHHVDALEIEVVVCGFHGNTTVHGWPAVVRQDLELGGDTVDGYDIHNVLIYELEAEPEYLIDLLGETRAKAQEWKLNQDTAQNLPRAARRVGL